MSEELLTADYADFRDTDEEIALVSFRGLARLSCSGGM